MKDGRIAPRVHRVPARPNEMISVIIARKLQEAA